MIWHQHRFQCDGREMLQVARAKLGISSLPVANGRIGQTGCRSIWRIHHRCHQKNRSLNHWRWMDGGMYMYCQIVRKN